MKHNILKRAAGIMVLFAVAFAISSFTVVPQTTGKAQDAQQTRGGGPYDYFIHATAEDTYVQFELAEGCWITVQDYEYTFEGGVVRIIIGANNNPYPREISITFSSDCMGMDRVLLVGQDGTEEPYNPEK